MVAYFHHCMTRNINVCSSTLLPMWNNWYSIKSFDFTVKQMHSSVVKPFAWYSFIWILKFMISSFHCFTRNHWWHWWHVLTIFPDGANAINSTLIQCFHKRRAVEKLLEEYCAISVIQFLTQLKNYSLSQAVLNLLLVSKVHVHFRQISRFTGASEPELKSLLDRFVLHVLLHRWSALEFDHVLNNSLFAVIRHCFWEHLVDMINQRTNFTSFIWFFVWFAVICKVNILKNFFERLSSHNVSDSFISNIIVTFPIMMNGWNLVDTHYIIHAKEGLHFCCIRNEYSSVLLGIAVGLYNYEGNKFVKLHHLLKYTKRWRHFTEVMQNLCF